MKKSVMITRMIMAVLITGLMAAGSAWAREVITVKLANGGTYNVTAYNTSTRTYYFLNGNLGSDSHQITVPNGYACTITVTRGSAVGTRNLYEEKDPLNPIYEVKKKSTYVLELVRVGTGTSPGVGLNSAPGLPGAGGGDDGQRQPPPGQ